MATPQRALNAFTMPVKTFSTFRLLPAGAFRSAKGEPAFGAWRLTAANAAALISAASNARRELVIDWDSELAAKIGALEWRDDGLYAANVVWTHISRVKFHANDAENISVSFSFDPETQEIVSLDAMSMEHKASPPIMVDIATLSFRKTVVALNHLQMGEARGAHGLTESEARIATCMGIEPEAFAAQLREDATQVALLKSSTGGESRDAHGLTETEARIAASTGMAPEALAEKLQYDKAMAVLKKVTAANQPRDANGLTDDQARVAAAFGITPDAFAAQMKATEDLWR